MKRIRILVGGVIVFCAALLIATAARADVTITGIKVSIDNGAYVWCDSNPTPATMCTRQIWTLPGGSVTLTAGQTLVLTQNQANHQDNPSGASSSAYNFDTSDRGEEIEIPCSSSGGTPCTVTSITIATAAGNFSFGPDSNNAIINFNNEPATVTLGHQEASDWALAKDFGAGLFTLSLGYADNVHTEQCADAPDRTCLPENPWTDATVFLGHGGPRQDAAWNPLCTDGNCFDAGAILIKANSNPPANVAIIKFTNGADANVPDGTDVPNVVPGSTVTWTYKVTNTGQTSVPRAQVVVTDNVTGVTPTFSSEQSGNGDTIFDPGEVWLYTATGTALDLTLSPPAGTHTVPNSCTAGGTQPPRTAYTNIGTVNIPGASASDPSSYCNPPPAPACVIPASVTTISNTSWNKFNVPPGTSPFLWINAHLSTNALPANVPIDFTNVVFNLNGTNYQLPNGEVIFDPSASSSTTTFTAGSPGQWKTIISKSSDEIFFDGQAIPVDANISGGGKAGISFVTQTSNLGLSFNWQWSAAVYTFWPGNSAANILAVHNSLHAGTPQNTQVQKSLIQGPRGGGGSNFTGSWSATGSGTCQ